MIRMSTNKLEQNSQKLIQVFTTLSKSARLEFLQMFMRTHTSQEYKDVIDTLGEIYWKTIPRA